MQEIKEHIATKKLIPQLRFKEFDGACSVRVYSELAKVIDCKHRTPPYVEEGIPLVSPGTIKWGEIDLISPKKRVSEKEYESLMDHCSPALGDLVFSRNQSIGVASYLKKVEKFVLGQDTVLIQSKEIDSGYNYFRLQTYTVQCLIDRLSGGSTFARINLSDLRKLKITVANDTKEQQKIAAFLSAVDEKIQQATKKKELLEQYKEGVMQQLFSGQLRFKDENGNPYPDWEEKRLGEVLTIGSGRDHKHLDSGDIPVYGTGGYMRSVNEKLYSGETVFIGRKGTIDKPFYFDGDFWTVDTLFYTHKFKNVLPKFIYAVFQQVNWKLHNEASGVPSLSKSTIEKIKFEFPVVEEQQKIATYLSSIDTRIEAVNNQITQTQTFKKGLLQQMFV